MRTFFSLGLGLLLLAGAALQGTEEPQNYKSSIGKRVQASANNSVSQTNVPTGEFAILFDTNLLPPSHIRHPFDNDSSQFRLDKDGIYLIGWQLTASNAAADTITIRLFDVTTNSVIASTVVTQGLAAGIDNALAGQFLLAFERDEVLQLQATSTAGSLTILNPSIFFKRVDAD
jgi:hypothetical protein